MSYRTASGQLVRIGQLLASGGEGDVFAVTSHRGTVLKKYKPDVLAKRAWAPRKLNAMLAKTPPEWRDAGTGFIMLAWPSQVVLENGRFTGFLMSQVDTANTVAVHRVANPSDRRAATGPTAWVRGFTWRYLVHTAANLAHVTHVLHKAGVVVGDFNERNILVSSQARITLIDCDSMQVKAADGEPFFCEVGRPEFTPPELVNANWKHTFRHPSSDLFALGIHVYQLLMEGEHPFRGVWSGGGEKPSVSQLAREGMWVHRPAGLLGARPAAIEFGLLPAAIQEMFRKAFEDGATSPARRPTALAWNQALTGLAASLKQCRSDPAHAYPPHLGGCPWCARPRPTVRMPATGPTRRPPRSFRR